VFMARAHEEGGSADRSSDHPAVDQLPAGLVRPTQKSVRRAADTQSLLARPLEQALAVNEAYTQRLVGIDVLPGLDRAKPDWHVRLRHGKVDDDLDLRIGEELLDGGRPQAKLFGLGFGYFRHRIGERADVEDRETPCSLEIGPRDVTAAD